MVGPGEERTSARTCAVAAAAAFLLALVVKLPQLGFAHREPDEVIYWQLAQRLWQDGVYSLRGTRVLELLPASMYDHALFHHPPLLPLLLGPWAANSAALYPPGSTLLVTFIAHGLFAAATVALGLRLARRAADRTAVALAVGAVALDPFGWFASRFLWIDALSLACAAGAAWAAFGRSGRGWLLLGGALAALAALAKLTGLVVLGALLVERLLRGRERALGDLAALVGPALVLVGGWLAVFATHTGALLPTWIAPGPEVLERDALMRGAFARSPLDFARIAPQVQPLVLWVALALAAGGRGGGARREGALLVWLVGGGAAVAATALLGTTPVLTRQLAPVVPALYALAVPLLVERRALGWRASFAACAALAALAAARDVHAAGVYELRGVLG